MSIKNGKYSCNFFFFRVLTLLVQLTRINSIDTIGSIDNQLKLETMLAKNKRDLIWYQESNMIPT